LECIDSKLPNVLILGILRVVPIRVINTRGLKEQTAKASLRAKREDVSLSNSKRLTLSISINVS
jgi:hypothetical protein